MSACLLGAPVRHDGGDRLLSDPRVQRWRLEGRLVSICPEEAGRLGTPRPPAEIRGQRVMASTGADVTDEFRRGAEAALALARRYRCRFALLKESSPSCGVRLVHDGTFSNRKIAGRGVTAALLEANDIRIFSEAEIDALEEALAQA